MKLFKLEIFNAFDATRYHSSCKQVTGVINGFFLIKDVPKKRDYAQANDIGTRGVYDFYILEKGSIYKINEFMSVSASDKM